MNKFIIGKKIGMSRIFSENGIDIPITVIEAGPCPITQIKNNDRDGYSSIQLGYDDFTEKKSTKARLGHLKASSSNPKKVLKEFKVDSSDGYKLGENITLSSFSVGESVSVTGISKGKGFTGHMKRHGFGGGRRSHGKNSVMRKAGSIGAGSDPSRVWPGTRMAGRHGNKTVKVENLEIVKLNESNNLMYVKGSVPGSVNGYLYLEAK
tara:strand:+ start:1537 stop:2160 length:624 start_codon:yes stop_codon:yes gene_type:complete